MHSRVIPFNKFAIVPDHVADLWRSNVLSFTFFREHMVLTPSGICCSGGGPGHSFAEKRKTIRGYRPFVAQCWISQNRHNTVVRVRLARRLASGKSRYVTSKSAVLNQRDCESLTPSYNPVSYTHLRAHET